jgi:hypothetical protein
MTRKITRIQLRRGTTAQWAEADPILARGEMGVDTTTSESRIGDGVRPWSELPTAADTATNAAQTAADRVQTGLDRAAAIAAGAQAAASAASAALSSAAAGAASGRLEIVADSQLNNFVYSAPGEGQQVVSPGNVINNRSNREAYQALASDAATFDNSGTGGLRVFALPRAGAALLTSFGAVGDWDNATQTGTDNQNAIARAIAALNAGRISKVILPPGAFFHSGNLPKITRQGVVFEGQGGLSRVSSLVCGALSGVHMHIEQRAAQINSLRLLATTARRNAGNPTTSGGITDGHGLLIGRDENQSIVSSCILRDVLIEGQPTDSLVQASSGEMAIWENVWIVDGVRHGFVWGSGPNVAGFTNHTVMSFSMSLKNLRVFECGGHAYYAPPRSTDGETTRMLTMENCQSLGCLWKREHDQSGGLYQSFIAGDGNFLTSPQYEDQQYANTVTSAGRSRVANALPARGCRASRRSTYTEPYFSSLQEGLFAPESGVRVINPIAFRGTYGTRMTRVVRMSSVTTGGVVEYNRGRIEGNTGDPDGVHPEPVEAYPGTNVVRNGKRLRTTLQSVRDIEIEGEATVSQIIAGNVQNVFSDNLLIAERDRTPTGADSFGRIAANADMDGLEITLRANASDVITVNNAVGTSGSVREIKLGASTRVLSGGVTLRVRYIHALNAWCEVGFFQ